MEANELNQPQWLEADALADKICGCADEAQHREDIARLLAYREAAMAEGMERAAVIARRYATTPLGSTTGWSDQETGWHETGSIDTANAIATAILAAKGTDHES